MRNYYYDTDSIWDNWESNWETRLDYSAEPTHKILVYGTLRKGEGNHSLLRDSKLLETVRVPGYRMYSNGGFPYSVPVDDESCVITGEIYHVNDAVLEDLDGLEGVKYGHYDRVGVKGYEDVELYVPHDIDRVLHLQVVKDGDWMNAVDDLYSWRREYYKNLQ